MNASIDFLDFLLPGDATLNIPAFSKCDDLDSISYFVQLFSPELIERLSNMNLYEYSHKELLTEIKNQGEDIRPIIEKVLAFYFSRPDVVVPLTGRTVPLSASGMSKY